MFFIKKFLLLLLTLIAFLYFNISIAADNLNNLESKSITTSHSQSSSSNASDSDTIKKKTKYHISNLELHRSLNGSAIFNIIFENNIDSLYNYDTELSKDGYTLTITFENTSISDKWISSINTKVFNTIVDSIKISQVGESVVFKIHSFAKITASNFKSGNSISFKIDRRQSQVEGFNVNKPLSISFKNTPVQTVLQVLAKFAGLNLVVSNSVQGNISINLKNVPWNDIMNVVLVSKGLATKKMGSILYVATAAEISTQGQIEAETNKSLENNAHLETAFIPLNYTTAQNAQAIITSMAQKNGGIMSSRGSVTSDARTNTLIVTDMKDRISKIRQIIKQIDIPNDQVLIEARIVEVSKNDQHNLGFNYNLSGSGFDIGLNTFDAPKSVTTAGASNVRLGYSLGGVKLGMEIQALEEEDLANDIASPHVIVANNETAFIKSGKDVPYNQSTASGAASIAFEEAVMELQVTPQIAPDGDIILNLLVTKNSVNSNTSSGSSSNDGSSGVYVPPQITKREITTKVMIKDGQTIVIGGIYENKKVEYNTKIPLLGDIPFLGSLFSYKRLRNQDEELLVFITPKIIESKINI